MRPGVSAETPGAIACGVVGVWAGRPWRVGGTETGSHAQISATEQSPAHRLSRRPLGTLQQVAVYVLSNSDAGVPEHLGHHLSHGESSVIRWTHRTRGV
jgi:hypothetical protein